MKVTVAPTQTSHLSGDIFRATLSFESPPKPSSNDASESTNTNSTCHFAWGFAQLIGTFGFDTSLVHFDSTQIASVRSKAVVVGSGFGGIAMAEVLDREGKDRMFPIFSTTPSMLFYDLVLKEGETRSISYEIKLPKDLPPSHRGKSIKISYKLIVCVQRAAPNQKPQILQVPLRVFSALGDLVSRRIYNVTAPIVITEDIGVVEEIQSSEYEILRKSDLTSMSIAVEGEEEETTLTQRLIMLCQRSGKVAFDICKNEDIVAHFILIRGAFRLGETVLGVLDFSKGTVPCFQVSAFLEQTETVNDGYTSPNSPSEGTRRVLAQQHSCTINTSRMDISLTIPASATPHFSTTAVSLSYSIRLEFITSRGKPNLQEPVRPLIQPTAADVSVPDVQNFYSTQTPATVNVEAFECVLGVKVYPSGSMGSVMKTFDIK
ncbi:Rgp1-domain-containing protein [Obelidium mucronatum]|nr:Rgp1-domain-containing protein [Obelidium mucronatum]